jgi:heme exporter protein D
MSSQAIEWIAYGLLLVALVIAAIYSVAADTARLDRGGTQDDASAPFDLF